ncbi:MAG: hypothetical protein ACI4TI_01545, partial [Christensenellales bacterium]
MKLKKILTIFVFSIITFTGIFFGCKDKYLNFEIVVNGENEIQLRAGETVSEEEQNSHIVEILIKNAPNDNCRVISYSVSQNNIVTIEELASTSKDIKRYKITALENITASKPSTIITFKSGKGNKSCQLKIDVEIPILNLTSDLSYSAYAVSDGQPYYIDSSRAFVFMPSNTTERNVEFELVDTSLTERFGVTVSKSGAVVVPSYFDSEGKAIPSTIKVRATSVNRSAQLLQTEVDVFVLREVTEKEIVFSEDLNGKKYYTGTEQTETTLPIDTLQEKGLVFASNIESLTSANFEVEIKEEFGLNFEQLELLFDKTTLSNVIVEQDNSKSTKNKLVYKIYSTNPGEDEIVLTIRYKNAENYCKTFVIPVRVLEYPNSLIVNDSLSLAYNIFDYYKDSAKGQEFRVNISQFGAYDKRFKVFVEPEDFELIEVRYLNEVLDYQSLLDFVFENNSSIFVKAKTVEGAGKDINIKFYSNILTQFDNEFGLEEPYKDLTKTIKLNLVPGIRRLEYSQEVSSDVLYLEKGKQIEIPFVINGTSVDFLNEFVNLEINQGAELVEINKNADKFVLKSILGVGNIEFCLSSENGIQTSKKTIKIYAGYDETSENKFALNLFGNNIKKIAKQDSDGNVVVDEKGAVQYDYYLGSTLGKNSANFKIGNPQNSTIYRVEATSNNDSIKVSVLDKDELLFNLYALENVNEAVLITVSLWVFNDNDEVNESGKLTKEITDIVGIPFEINTYEPIGGVTFVNGEVSSEIELVDGEALDKDSLEKELNMLDLNKLIIVKGNAKNITTKYVFPSNIVEAEYDDEKLVSENDFHRTNKGENEIFDKFYFHTAKNHKFVNGQFVFGLTILINDLEGGDEPYVLTLKVVLKEQVKPEKVEILNENGFVYVANTDPNIAQIKAKVVGEDGKVVTNNSLFFESEGTSISVDSFTGVITVNHAGITKVKVSAKASQYQEGGEYSKYSYVYVVVADGSVNYPYVLTNVDDLVDNKYYTLAGNLLASKTITKHVAGIDGKFAYAKYSNIDENAVSNLIFVGKGSVFEDEISMRLQNLNIVCDQNSVDINEDFGLIAKENKGTITNVNLICNSLQIKNVSNIVLNVGLMFAKNSGTIENCGVSSQNTVLSNVVLNGTSMNFGGIVCENTSDILGNFNFLNSQNVNSINLKIVDLTEKSDCFVAGAVAKNFGNLRGLKVKAEILSGAKYVGGIAGQIVSDGLQFKNLHFSGNIVAENENSVVGGIASCVQTSNATDKVDFELVFVEFVSEQNMKNGLSGNLVGGLFGSADFLGEARTNVKHAFVKSFVASNDCDLKGKIVGGLVGEITDETKLSVVMSDAKLLAETAGAFVGKANANLTVDNAYSYALGAENLVGARTGNLVLNKVYATSCSEEKRASDQFENFFDKFNYSSVISNPAFNDGKHFKYSSSENGGKPYLVYNEIDGYKKLMTVVAKSINATFETKDFVDSSKNKYSYGINNNVIVINDSVANKAILYFGENVEYDIYELLNFSFSPSDAVMSYDFASSNNSVVSVVRGGNSVRLKIVGIGNAVIEISNVYDNSVKSYVYVSVVDKITSVDFESEVVLSKGTTKQVKFDLTGKTENNGLYFNLKNDEISSKILINNKSADENFEIYHTDSMTIVTGLELLNESTIQVAPFCEVQFGAEVYNFVDYQNLKTVLIKVVNRASVVTSSVNYFSVSENETVSFDVYVDSNADEASQNLVFESVDAENGDLSQYFDISILNKQVSGNQTLFGVCFVAKNLNLSSDKNFEVRVKHQIADEVNNDVFAVIDVLLRSSKLKGVELNHYSSSVHYYSAYDYILKKETTPSFDITKGNFGVLNINLYPSYSNITEVEVSSSIENGNRIYFGQLALNENDELRVTSHKANLATGIKLKIDKNELKQNGGNLYVSTLLSTNVVDDTDFTITVTCYYGLGQKYEPTTLTLKAKALTTIMLSNANGDGNFVLPKGGQIALNVSAINMKEDFVVGADNFKFFVGKNELTPVTMKGNVTEKDGFDFVVDKESGALFGFKVENGQLIVCSDLMNARNTKLTILPVYSTVVNGKEVQSEGSQVELRCADFYVKNISVEGEMDGILTNYLGNSTMLKAKLDVETCSSIYYFDKSGEIISGYSYFDENGNIVDVEFAFAQRELELSNLNLKINTLTELVSKSNYSWNLITKNNAGNVVYNNIKDSTTYSNFVVTVDADGYYYVSGKNVSESNMMIKVNLSYENGLVSLNQNSDIELSNQFVLVIKTQSSLDNPTPITSFEEFAQMEDDGNYILLSNITLPANFGGIDAKIASFDGNNKTINIQGFVIENTSQNNLGLFNEIGENAVIKNVRVNILPSLFYSDNYYYGLNINAQALEKLNFGVLCGINKGVITNCQVVNDNFKLVNNKNAYKEIWINVNASEEKDIVVGGLVGQNDGYITHSSVGDANSSNAINIVAKAKMGGFVAVNNKKIASSFVVNTALYNNAKSKITAGFVAENNLGSQVVTSYVQGYSENPAEILLNKHLEEGGIFANGYVGGFVTINSGFVKDCYSNIVITTNKRSSGFVYDNTNGSVETCLSATKALGGTQSFRYFTGNDEENLTLNNAGIKSSYYLLDASSDVNGGEGEYDEPANGIISFEDASFFEGFVCDDSQSSIWSFGNGLMPRLVDADQKIVCERQCVDTQSTEKYEYVYINNNIGSINNPILVSTTEQFFDALTDERNLYEYYYGGKIIKTKINYNHIQIVKDLDLSRIIDINNNETSTTNEVQKLQDIIFAGSLNGNGMLLDHITITAKNDKVKYSSFGLFKQIGVEQVYDSYGNLKNDKLDEDSCSTIKNANFAIDGISATITKTVGTLSGEVLNSKLYNINLYNNNGVVVTGNNIVGGVAGRISGNSFVKGVSSNLGVKATFENKSANYDYETVNEKRVYRNAFDVVEDNLNNEINIVGGLFGVVDIYKTTISSLNQTAGAMSYYVNAKITREIEPSFDKAQIQFTKVYDNVQISGDIAGGLFGFVAKGSGIYDAKFVLNESANQNLNANYAVGGIAGKNEGFVSYATVEAEMARQRIIDKTSQQGYLTSYLFSHSSNKATFVGGLVGILDGGMLSYSYNKANVSAKSSRFVGAVVGAFANAKIEYVYANSYLACQQQVNEGGLITQQKGYAGFIGTITSFDAGSFVSYAVSILKNGAEDNVYGMVGYNQSTGVKILGEYSKNAVSVCGGMSIAFVDSNTNNSDYEDYVNQNSNTFANFDQSDCFTKTPGLDTFYRLTYNKKGAVRAINNENDLRNMLSNGNCVLESDIYLTSPWDPIEFSGQFSSAERTNGESKYTHYVIYNLTINSQSKNVSNNVGFFLNTKNAQINNITFVVGSNYTDPALRGEQFKNTDPTELDIDENWGNGTSRGINIINNRVAKNYSLGVLSAVDENSLIKNTTIKFVDDENFGILTTNLNYVGGLVGRAKNTTIDGIKFENLNIKREQVQNFDAYVGGVCGRISSGKISDVQFACENKIVNLQGVENGLSFVGGVCAEAVDGTEIVDVSVNSDGVSSLEVIHTAEGKASANDSGNSVYAGLLAGSTKGAKIENVELSNAKLTTTNNYSKLKQYFVGGLVGYNNSGYIKNAMLKSSVQILAQDNSTE